MPSSNALARRRITRAFGSCTWTSRRAFTGDLDRHRAELAEIWGGPLCMVEHEHTLAQLMKVQEELGMRAKELRLLSSSTDEVRNRVVVDVIFADADDRAEMDEKYGKGTVVLSSALRPAE
jgi:hypothetical protein